ncbi:hypothetical protein BB558_001474 [Smittium angustum]|uniref:DUF747 family protein n=1 Tax=Smittium angustum TaxID=133377 RepID=A0A2U1JBH6_SMIAN|nr:hypothetical protein BB558_001474 [Smittium angustum]
MVKTKSQNRPKSMLTQTNKIDDEILPTEIKKTCSDSSVKINEISGHFSSIDSGSDFDHASSPDSNTGIKSHKILSHFPKIKQKRYEALWLKNENSMLYTSKRDSYNNLLPNLRNKKQQIPNLPGIRRPISVPNNKDQRLSPYSKIDLSKITKLFNYKPRIRPHSANLNYRSDKNVSFFRNKRSLSETINSSVNDFYFPGNKSEKDLDDFLNDLSPNYRKRSYDNESFGNKHSIDSIQPQSLDIQKHNHNRSGSTSSMVIILKDPRRDDDLKNNPESLNGTSGENILSNGHTEIDFETSKYEAELLRKRVVHFLSVPWEIEKLMTLGLGICTTAFLRVFVDLPIESLVSIIKFTKVGFSSYIKAGYKNSKESSTERQKTKKELWKMAEEAKDIYKLFIISAACFFVGKIDAAQVYHTIRAQSALKLYFIYNSLELFDKLCTSFGIDVLDSIEYSFYEAFEKSTKKRTKLYKSLVLSIHGFLGLLYLVIHALVLYFQVLSLNVAINSYSQQLLMLLISNQFVELKGNILKKFEKENFFQLTCGDIVERFQEIVFLILIVLRNFIELVDPGSVQNLAQTSSSYVKYIYFISSANSIPYSLLYYRVLQPVLMVIGTEILVDWVKHAFISKYNWMRPQIYSRYGDILCRDLVGATAKDDVTNSKPHKSSISSSKLPEKHELIVNADPTSDLSTKVARRIGFLPYPLAVLTLLVVWQSVTLITGPSIEFSDLIDITKAFFLGDWLKNVYLMFSWAFWNIGCTFDQVCKSMIGKDHTFSGFFKGKCDSFPNKNYSIPGNMNGKESGTFSNATTHNNMGWKNLYLNKFESLVYSILFVLIIFLLFALCRISFRHKLKRYAARRYLIFCKRLNVINQKQHVVEEKDKSTTRNIQIEEKFNTDGFGHHDITTNHMNQDETTELQNTSDQNKGQVYGNEPKRDSLNVQNDKEKDTSREESKESPVKENKGDRNDKSIKKKSSIIQYDDLTKSGDLQKLKDVRNLLALDPEEIEWEKTRPKWSLDNIHRFSLFKSRIP